MHMESTRDDPNGNSLTPGQCWDKLRDGGYGRLAVTTADGPDIFPINGVVDHGTILFRTREGTKLIALRDDHRAAYEIDGYDPASDHAWSVVVRGYASEVTAMHESLDAVELGVTPWQRGPKPIFVRINPHSVTGRWFERADRAEWQVTGVPVHRSPIE